VNTPDEGKERKNESRQEF